MDFKELSSNLGIDEEDFIELVELLIDTTQDDIDKIKESLSNADAQGASMAAHSIKGASGNLGFMSLSESAKEMEMTAKEGNLDNFEPLLAKTEEELQSVRDKLDQQN